MSFGGSEIRPRFLMTGQKEASFVQREVAFSLENDGGIDQVCVVH